MCGQTQKIPPWIRWTDLEILDMRIPLKTFLLDSTAEETEHVEIVPLEDKHTHKATLHSTWHEVTLEKDARYPRCTCSKRKTPDQLCSSHEKLPKFTTSDSHSVRGIGEDNEMRNKLLWKTHREWPIHKRSRPPV